MNKKEFPHIFDKFCCMLLIYTYICKIDVHLIQKCYVLRLIHQNKSFAGNNFDQVLLSQKNESMRYEIQT